MTDPYQGFAEQPGPCVQIELLGVVSKDQWVCLLYRCGPTHRIVFVFFPFSFFAFAFYSWFSMSMARANFLFDLLYFLGLYFFSMPSTTRLISAKKPVSALFFLFFPSMIQSCLIKTGRSFCRAWGCHKSGNDTLTNRRSAGPIDRWDVCQCQNKWLGQKITVKVGFFREVTDS